MYIILGKEVNLENLQWLLHLSIIYANEVGAPKKVVMAAPVGQSGTVAKPTAGPSTLVDAGQLPVAVAVGGASQDGAQLQVEKGEFS